MGLEETAARYRDSAQWFPISLIPLHSHVLIVFITALSDERGKGSTFITAICKKV